MQPGEIIILTPLEVQETPRERRTDDGVLHIIPAGSLAEAVHTAYPALLPQPLLPEDRFGYVKKRVAQCIAAFLTCSSTKPDVLTSCMREKTREGLPWAYYARIMHAAQLGSISARRTAWSIHKRLFKQGEEAALAWLERLAYHASPPANHYILKPSSPSSRAWT